jgi:hypothetical protein
LALYTRAPIDIEALLAEVDQLSDQPRAARSGLLKVSSLSVTCAIHNTMRSP